MIQIRKMNRAPHSGWVEFWEVPSHSNPNSGHVVALSAKGKWGCDCWPWRRTRENCKHIDEAIAFRKHHESNLQAVTIDQPQAISLDKFEKMAGMFAKFEA